MKSQPISKLYLSTMAAEVLSRTRRLVKLTFETLGIKIKYNSSVFRGEMERLWACVFTLTLIWQLFIPNDLLSVVGI